MYVLRRCALWGILISSGEMFINTVKAPTFYTLCAAKGLLSIAHEASIYF